MRRPPADGVSPAAPFVVAIRLPQVANRHLEAKRLFRQALQEYPNLVHGTIGGMAIGQR